jgi:hypothetical protein
MNRSTRLFVCLVSTLATVAALGQETDQSKKTKASAPVAFVCVTRPTHIDGFAAASDGKLTPVKGSPFAATVSSISLNKKYLFGAGGNGIDLYSYAIASDGAINLVSTTSSQKYNNGCPGGLLAIDYTGSTLYNESQACEAFQSFNIDQSNGDLQFLGSSTATDEYSELIFLGTNQYAYTIGCWTEDVPEPFTATYKRESNGFLTLLNTNTMPLPPTRDAYHFYCPTITPQTGDYLTYDLASTAGDPTHHLAVAVQDSSPNGPLQGPIQIATYTADSHGNLTTNSTWSNMATTAQNLTVSATSISPTGKLLAVGGQGFQVFHFNGGAQASAFSNLLQPNYSFVSFAWDDDDHLYAIGGGKLFVYKVTTTTITEAPGSPYSIPQATQVLALSK